MTDIWRRKLIAGGTALGLSLGLCAAPADRAALSMEIKRSGAEASRKGPPGPPAGRVTVTGTVRVGDPLFQTAEPGRVVSGGHVTFEPGARTYWHTHPLGQTVIITSGLGWVQREGGPIEEVRPGDIVWFPAGEKHWHGASASTAMTFITLTESLNGKSVDWLDAVSDDQYRR
jgi:quercetin dioxygenase-like cupin family protein